MTLRVLSRRIPPSAAVLLLANLAPLAGMVLLDWNVFSVMLLFWLENVIVGVFNVLRMLWAAPGDVARWIAKVFMVPFFVFHYGMFTAIHGIFVVTLFGGEEIGVAGAPGLEVVWRILVEFKVVHVAVALALSHGFSFLWNYIRRGEYRRITLEKLMRQPYTRVVVLHVVIITSGFLVLALNAAVVGVFLLVALKMGVDVHAHLKEHRKLGAINPSPSSRVLSREAV